MGNAKTEHTNQLNMEKHLIDTLLKSKTKTDLLDLIAS